MTTDELLTRIEEALGRRDIAEARRLACQSQPPLWARLCELTPAQRARIAALYPLLQACEKEASKP